MRKKRKTNNQQEKITLLCPRVKIGLVWMRFLEKKRQSRERTLSMAGSETKTPTDRSAPNAMALGWPSPASTLGSSSCLGTPTAVTGEGIISKKDLGSTNPDRYSSQKRQNQPSRLIE